MRKPPNVPNCATFWQPIAWNYVDAEFDWNVDCTPALGIPRIDTRQTAHEIIGLAVASPIDWRSGKATGHALGAFATGHPGCVAGIFEQSIRRLPYSIAIALTVDELTDDHKALSILSVIHTARDWQDDRWAA